MTSSTAHTPETGDAQTGETQTGETQTGETQTGAPQTTAPHTAAEEAHTLAVSVNGERRDVPRGLTLDRLVATLTQAPSGVAAAVNEAVVPRGEWPSRPLAEGDRVEVLTAVQGG